MGVAEGLLTAQDRGGGVAHVLAAGQILQVDHVLGQPLIVGRPAGQRPLDLRVGHDSSALQIDQEHGAGLQAPAGNDVRLGDGQDAGLGGQHDSAVPGDGPAAGSQTVAVHDRPHLAPVGEDHSRRSVPRFDDARAVAVEGA